MLPLCDTGAGVKGKPVKLRIWHWEMHPPQSVTRRSDWLKVLEPQEDSGGGCPPPELQLGR